jgi:broad specificity phosphatase PhoE
MSNPEPAPALRAAPDTAEDRPLHAVPSRLLLVRHGESTWNAGRRIQGQLDPPLSERGVAQACDLAERLSGHRLAGFYSSDLTRARETARLIAPAVEVEPVPDPGLREIMLGEWEGKTREELVAGYPELWASWAREPDWDIVPGAEGAQPFADRVRSTLGRIRECHPEGDVLCVTHGGVIHVALLDVLARPSRGIFPFLIENCSLTVIQQTGGRTVVTKVNDTCHLS